jgi:hypothetical protein
MNIPFEYMFGVDVALKKLRPHAQFQLEGTKFTVWNDPTGSEPPSWEEVAEQIEKDQIAHDTYVCAHTQEQSAEKTPLSKQRLDVCKSCEFYKAVFFTCQKCGCFMPLKSLLSDSKCPEGKW